jgi:hypothetical protein
VPRRGDVLAPRRRALRGDEGPGRGRSSRIPPALARRLDRLARQAHRFHRFAHHPLCAAYEGEVLRLARRTFVCRGCALAAAGVVLGGAAGCWASPRLPLPALAALASLTVVACLAAVRPRGGRPRSKLATRALPAALAAFTAAHALRAPDAASLLAAAAALAAGALATVRYRRRGPDRGPCATCPERAHPAACSGHRRAVRRERAFARVAARLLSR